MKTLYLPLQKRWYEMIERGEKKEEYREIKTYWITRLKCRRELHGSFAGSTPMISKISFEDYRQVCFSYGYTKRRMTFECKEITIGKGLAEWGAPDHEIFIIKLGERIVNKS